MKLIAVSLFDRGVQAYGRPFFVIHENQAVRSVTDEVNNAQSDLFKHPADFDLFSVGEFDDGTGHFVPHTEGPRFIIACKSLLKVS